MKIETQPKTTPNMKQTELKAEGTSSRENSVCFTVRFSEKETLQRIG